MRDKIDKDFERNRPSITVSNFYAGLRIVALSVLFLQAVVLFVFLQLEPAEYAVKAALAATFTAGALLVRLIPTDRSRLSRTVDLATSWAGAVGALIAGLSWLEDATKGDTIRFLPLIVLTSILGLIGLVGHSLRTFGTPTREEGEG